MASTFTQPDFTSQTATVYKTAIDDSVAVMKRGAAAFAAHAQATPDMTVRVDAGSIFDGDTLTEVAAQNTGTIAAPTTDPRIDRVVIDQATGVVSVITGSEAPSPVPPAITAGKVPIAQVSLIVSQTTIVNGDITDERASRRAASVPHERKTADYTALAADRGRLLEMDKATAVSLFFTAAATLGEGWFVYVHNSGAGDLTLDPNGAESIDDAATVTLGQNQGAIVFCDGSAFWTVGRGGGRVLQVLQVQKTDTASTTSSAFATITGLSQAITLAKATNKVLCIASLGLGTSASGIGAFLFDRGGTDIGIGAAAGSRTRAGASGQAPGTGTMESIVMTHLDAPGSVGPHTYAVQWAEINAGTSYLNRTAADTDAAAFVRAASTLTLMEIDA